VTARSAARCATVATAVAVNVRFLTVHVGLWGIVDQGEEAFAEMAARPDFPDESHFDHCDVAHGVSRSAGARS